MAKYIIDISKENYEQIINHPYGLLVLSQDISKVMQNATPLDETFEWCHDCKEYDTEKHCCHRFTKVIRNTLKDNINAVLEDIKEEIWEVCNNLTYNENHAVGGSWGLRKSLEIIDNHMKRKE